MTNDLWASWRNMVEASAMIGETLHASHQVVEARQGTISDAFTNPLAADHAELALMVNEKTEAFASAGAALAKSWLAMQSDVTAQALAVSRVIMSGQLPAAKISRAMAARQRRIGDAALTGTMRALRPIHAAATGNARRLAKPKLAKRASA